jgi:hypothetical protein
VCIYIQAMPDTGQHGQARYYCAPTPGAQRPPPRAHLYGTEADGPAIGPHAAPTLALARHTCTKSARQVMESFNLFFKNPKHFQSEKWSSANGKTSPKSGRWSSANGRTSPKDFQSEKPHLRASMHNMRARKRIHAALPLTCTHARLPTRKHAHGALPREGHARA